MNAIQFHGDVHDGIIELPAEFHQYWSNKPVRVILLEDVVEKSVVSGAQNAIAELLNHPVLVERAIPLRRDEIYD